MMGGCFEVIRNSEKVRSAVANPPAVYERFPLY